MLQLYRPIQHNIFGLHAMLKHLVCEVWCNADQNSCESKLASDFKTIYKAYGVLKTKIDEIYEECKTLNNDERQQINEAFKTNNRIEELCEGVIKPVYLKDLPKVVETKMKPLLVNFYEELLDKNKVPGTKQDYYSKLKEANDFGDCPCCGLTYFEPADSIRREAFDHYLPKALYPFASINFQNLVPLCYKCNSDRKKDKNPIEAEAIAFYPFSDKQHQIDIEISFAGNTDLQNIKREELHISFVGDNAKLETWNRLFDMNDRYNEAVRGFFIKFLSKLKRRHQEYIGQNTNWAYTDTLDKYISDYEFDKYDDKKFLKIPLMKALKTCTHLLEVYDAP